MRTAKTLSISLPPQQLKSAKKLARRENRTMSELFREAFRRYEQQESPLLNDPARLKKLDELKATVDLLRHEAKTKGLDKMPMREINRAVATARRDQRNTSKRTVK